MYTLSKGWQGRTAVGLVAMALLLVGLAFQASAKTTVTVWAFPIGEDGGRGLYDNVVIPKFEEKYPDIELNIVIHPWGNRDERMLVAYASGSAPDIAYLNLDFFPKFIQQGMLEPLTRYYTPEIRNDYYENAMDAITFSGDQYGFPILQSLVSYYYNKTMFDETGLNPEAAPTNWDELAAASKKLTKRSSDGTTEQFGVALGMNDVTTNMNYNPFLWQAGGEVFHEDGKSVAFADEPGVEALEYITEFNRAGEAGGSFIDGTTGIQLGAANNSGITYTNREVLFDWAPGPVLKHKERVSYGTLAAYGMFNTSANKDAAAKVLRFMTSTEIMGTLLSNWGYLPPKRSVSPELFEQYKEWVGVFFNNAQYTHYDVLHPLTRDIYKILAPAVSRAFRLEEPAQSALEDAAHRANAYIKENLER